MKILIPALILAINTFAQDLGVVLNKKTGNYLMLTSLYEELLEEAHKNDAEAFCEVNDESRSGLEKILDDDNKLIRTLRTYQTPDMQNYATEMEENIATPLFSYHAYQDMCQRLENGFPNNLIKPLKGHLINLEFLSMKHEFFIDAYGSSKN